VKKPKTPKRKELARSNLFHSKRSLRDVEKSRKTNILFYFYGFSKRYPENFVDLRMKE
jgi:hypothetical protein